MAGLLLPAMALASAVAAGIVLIAAGIYQWTPLKQACLRHCRSPFEFLMFHWRDGASGALSSGVRHGLYCLGCCWMLMALLFVGGIMNIAWIAGIALLVLIEKVAPWGGWTERATGAVMIAWGAATLVTAALNAAVLSIRKEREGTMPIAKVRGVALNYEILGDSGPFVALQPGGRRAGSSLRSLASKIAEAGNRVVIYDRRNTGASDIAIEGELENQEWADDLHELLRAIDAQPAFVGGSSSGCRLALLLALQHPEWVRGLLLWRVTGGAHAAEHLTNQYYTSHIEAARRGGMAEVCKLDHWSEVIGINPQARDALMAFDREGFHRSHGAVAAGVPGRRRASGDRALPGRAAFDDDAGLHRSRHGPGASDGGRSGGAPSDAERRIRRNRHRAAGDARRGFCRLGRARGAARGALHRLPAPARAAIEGGAISRRRPEPDQPYSRLMPARARASAVDDRKRGRR